MRSSFARWIFLKWVSGYTTCTECSSVIEWKNAFTGPLPGVEHTLCISCLRAKGPVELAQEATDAAQ